MSFETHIAGIGAHLPPRVVTNEELAPLLDTTPEWITTRSGIRSRRWADPALATSDLAILAARGALDDAGIGPEAIDLIAFATLSSDHEFPGSAFFFQAKLGTRKVPVFDVRAQCSGFVYALSLADRYVRCGDAEHVLVVGAEMHSKGLHVHPDGKAVTMLFGDGAGAFVLRRAPAMEGEPRGIRTIDLHADGTFARALWIPAPGTGLGTAAYLEPAMLAQGLHYPQMDGHTVFMAAIAEMSTAIRSVLAREALQPLDVDVYVLHQANLRIVERVAEQLRVPFERFHNTIETTANTTAASLPIGVHSARAAGLVRPGSRVMIASFGAGFTWSAGLLVF